MARPLLLGLLPALLAAAAGPTARAGSPDALAEIRALHERGGVEATRALVPWVQDDEEAVRVAALEALGAVGIRTRVATRAVREAAGRRASIAQRGAALEALGRIGDADDVPRLVDALKGREESLRGVAHGALQQLTGRRSPLDYGRWQRWWRQEEGALQAGVRRALRQLPDAPGPERERLRTLLAETGWTAIRHAEDAVRLWLRASDRTLRSQAYYLAAVLRLGDTASDVESALPYLSTVDGEDGLRALRALGLDARRLAPYWRRRLEGSQ